MSKTATTPVGPSTTVNDVLTAIPESSGFLSDLGFDTCCGGSKTLEQQCTEKGENLNSVLEKLNQLSLKPA